MKNILITGGAGSIGINLIESLLESNLYNITVVDLKSIKATKKFKKIKDKIEIIYGDISDEFLMNKLIRKNDIVIHLASVTPPLANKYYELCEYINLCGTKKICDAINNVNNKCKLIYISSIIPKDISDIDDNYTKTNIKIEDYIEKNVTNYTLIRMQPLLVPKKNICINTTLNDKIQFINMKSIVNLLNEIIKNYKKYNNKTIDAHGGKKFITTYFNHISELKKISKLKYHRDQSRHGYRTNVINKMESYNKGSLEEYYKECGKK